MNKKITAAVLASVLASPLALARVAKASELEAETRFRDLVTNTRGEAEVEFGQRTRNGVTTSKLSLEFEISQPGTIAPIAGNVDFALQVGAGVTCHMSSTTDPVVKTIVYNGQTFQKVIFNGSFAQSTPPPATLIKGLDCGASDITTLLAGDTVNITVTGLAPLPDPIVFPATLLKLDD